MDDGGAEILDVVETALRGDPARLLRADAQLEPERLRAGVDRLPRVRRGVLGASEDVHEVDRAIDLGQGRDAPDAEHVVAVERAHGDHVVALR